MDSKERALRSSKEQIDDLNEQNDGLRDRIHSLEDEITEARRRVMRDADDHIDAVTALELKARADREMMAQRLREAEGERDIVLKSHGKALQNMGLDDDFVTDLGLKDEDDLDSLRAKAHALAVECKLRQSRLDDSEAQKTILSSRVLDLEESLTKLQEKLKKMKEFEDQNNRLMMLKIKFSRCASEIGKNLENWPTRLLDWRIVLNQQTHCTRLALQMLIRRH